MTRAPLGVLIWRAAAIGCCALVVVAACVYGMQTAPAMSAASSTRTATGTTGAVRSAAAGSTKAATKAAAGTSPVLRVETGWARRTATATGIPLRALLAYASADLTLAAERPGCGISWNTLAAIGEVESSQATEGGARLLETGVTDRPILGPVLDGTGFAAIRDTDSGRWDGNASWDRAVGPMQFLPSTWEEWAADGNADGISDPNQIDDAALAAARYLCAAGAMTTAAGWRNAIYAYNHSDSYVDDVAAIANRYAAAAPR